MGDRHSGFGRLERDVLTHPARDVRRALATLVVTLAAWGCGGAAPSAASDTTVEGAPVRFPDERQRPAPEASPLVKQAEARLGEGDVAGAEALLAQALEADPQDARAHFDRGLVLEMRQESEAALDAYRTALEHHPGFAEAHSNLGRLLRVQGALEAAVDELRAAVKADPGLASAHANLALALEDAGQLDAAVQAYREALSLASDDAMTRVNLGLLYVRQSDMEAASTELERVLESGPRERPVLLAIGNGLRLAGRPESALRAMRAAVDNGEPPTPALLSELALAERAVGDRSAAIGTLRRALELEASYATGHYLLASLLAADGAFAEAAEHFERYLALDPEGPHAEKARERLAVVKQQLR